MTVIYVKRVRYEGTRSLRLARKMHSESVRELLAYAVRMEYALEITDFTEMRTPKGKPYFEGAPFHFNLSHSGDYVVCALSDHEVGIDIEKIVPISLKVMRRFFGLSILSPKEQMRLWTRYESYGKMVGIGIPYPIESQKHCYFREFTELDRYFLTVCSPKEDIADHLILVGEDSRMLPFGGL